MLLQRTVRGLEEDNSRLAQMYEQVSKSNGDIVVGLQSEPAIATVAQAEMM